MSDTNQMVRLLAKVDALPEGLRARVRSFVLGRAIPFVGTAKLWVEEVTRERVVVRIHNRRRVQNHLKGVHAAAMALLAETASGFAIGMHLPDGKIPLIKSLRIDYVRRARGDLTAVAALSDDQLRAVSSEEKGEIAVSVTVTDSSGATPIVCEAIWAWIPRHRTSAEGRRPIP